MGHHWNNQCPFSWKSYFSLNVLPMYTSRSGPYEDWLTKQLSRFLNSKAKSLQRLWSPKPIQSLEEKSRRLAFNVVVEARCWIVVAVVVGSCWPLWRLPCYSHQQGCFVAEGLNTLLFLLLCDTYMRATSVCIKAITVKLDQTQTHYCTNPQKMFEWKNLEFAIYKILVMNWWND